VYLQQRCTFPWGFFSLRVLMSSTRFELEQPETWAPAWLFSTDPVQAAYVHSLPLTKYETAVIKGVRALEIGQGAASRCTTIDATADVDPLTVASAELASGTFPPMAVLRYLPDGSIVPKTVADTYHPRRV
jgi:DNA-directed RNA polymerase subunit K/omega